MSSYWGYSTVYSFNCAISQSLEKDCTVPRRYGLSEMWHVCQWLVLQMMVMTNASNLSAWFAFEAIKGHWKGENISNTFISLRMRLIFQTKVSLSCFVYFKSLHTLFPGAISYICACTFGKLRFLQRTKVFSRVLLIAEFICSLGSKQGTRLDLIWICRSGPTIHSSCLFQFPLLCYLLVVLYHVHYHRTVVPNTVLCMVINRYSKRYRVNI